MSLQFNVTASPYNGIIQRIEQEVYGMDGLTRISGNTTLLGQWTTSVNLALDRAFDLIFEVDGRWQFDDPNHTKHPILYIDLVSGQRDYTFSKDEQSNLILDIEKLAVLTSASGTLYQEIKPTDIDTDKLSAFIEGDTTSAGVPLVYDKLGSGIFLDPIPNYAATNGLKVYYTREGNYYTTSDTTQEAGIDGRVHEYLVVKPAFDYAMTNNLTNVNTLRERTLVLENRIREIYSRKAQDERNIMTPKRILYI